MSIKIGQRIARRFCLLTLLGGCMPSLVSAAVVVDAAISSSAAATLLAADHGTGADAGGAPALASFLDEGGRLNLPADFTGSLDPSGYRLVSGKGEALRFAPEAAKSGSGNGWTGFGGIGNGCNGSVRAVAIGSAGEVYIGGDFTLCGDAPANRIVRFDTSTQTWASLGSGQANGVNSTVAALAISGSTLYVGGDFTLAGGAPANRVARFDTSTQTWASLGSGAANGVVSSAFGVLALVISDGTLYAGGLFDQAGGLPANNIARFDTSTQTWASLGSDAANGVNSIVRALVVSGSTVYAGGNFTLAGGATANRVARFDTSTQSWASLGSGAANGVNSAVSALTISGGMVYAGGDFSQAGGAVASRVARFDTSTQTWASLGSGAANGVNSTVRTIVVSGSAVYVGGFLTQAGGAPANRIAHFDTTTELWASLGSGVANGVTGSVLALAVADSTVYAGGGLSAAGGAPANNAASFDTSTLSWAALGGGASGGVNGSISALTVFGSKVYVGGVFTQAGGLSANRIAQFDTLTQTWSSLGSGTANGSVSALEVSGSSVYVGGGFTEAGGVAANNVARFDTTTQTWASLGSGLANGVNNSVSALAISGDTLYVGGNFTQAGGAPANRVARFDTSTEVWASLGSGAANGVSGPVPSVAALVVSGGTVYVGGSFFQAGGAPANSVARFDTSTQTWSSLGSGAANGVSGGVGALSVSGSTVYVGGFFSQAGGAPANGIARFDTSTEGWASLGNGATDGVNGSVVSLAVSGNSVYVGGGFTQAGGAPANGIARFDTTTQGWASLGSGASNGVSGSVSALATIVDSTLYVGGNFGSAGAQVSSNIARYLLVSPLRLSVVPATVLVGNSSAISVSGGMGSGAVSVELASGGTFCSLNGASLMALAAGECVLTATKAADGTFPEQSDSVLVRTVTTTGVNLVVAFSALPPGAAPGLLSFAGRGACAASAYRISVRNNGPLDAAEVRLQMPAPRGLLPPVSWLCVLGNGQCTPESGQAAVDTRFALTVGAQAEIDLSACPDPNAAFADFQFQASLPGGNLLFPTEAQGNVSAPLNNEGVFRNGFE